MGTVDRDRWEAGDLGPRGLDIVVTLVGVMGKGEAEPAGSKGTYLPGGRGRTRDGLDDHPSTRQRRAPFANVEA